MTKDGTVYELDGFVMEEARGVYRPAGSVAFDRVVTLVNTAITLSRAKNVRELLVDTTALTGFPSPDTFQRFVAAVNWAAAAKGKITLAMVAREEMIDARKFGVLVAGNRGLNSNIFPTEVEALKWLDAKSGSAS